MTPINKCIYKQEINPKPIWLMRQAVDIFLNLEKLEEKKKLCKTLS